jgi:hypothetical protein
MRLVTRRIACFCEATFEAQIPESGDLQAEPEIADLVASGDFMAVGCPACGKRLTPEYPFRLTGVKGIGEILLIPEAQKTAFLQNRIDYPIGSPDRVVVGFPELAEKLLISARGLDDRVIEVMKYYLLTGEAAKAAPAGELSLSYKGEQDGRHVFHVTGMKEGEVAVLRLPREIYDRIAADISRRVREEPFRDFCDPPWVSLRKAAGDVP